MHDEKKRKPGIYLWCSGLSREHLLWFHIVNCMDFPILSVKLLHVLVLCEAWLARTHWAQAGTALDNHQVLTNFLKGYKDEDQAAPNNLFQHCNPLSTCTSVFIQNTRVFQAISSTDSEWAIPQTALSLSLSLSEDQIKKMVSVISWLSKPVKQYDYTDGNIKMGDSWLKRQ